MESFCVTAIIPARPERVLAAWLSEAEHTSFTGGARATLEPRPGGSFTALGGRVHGRRGDRGGSGGPLHLVVPVAWVVGVVLHQVSSSKVMTWT